MKVTVRKAVGTQDPPLVEALLTMSTAEAEATIREGSLSEKAQDAIVASLGEHLTAGRRRVHRQVQ